MEQYKKLKVYLVMNDEDMLQQCMTVLARFEDVGVIGFSMNPQEVIGRIGQLLPDLVLVEMSMPRLDGITLALQCQERFGKDTPGFMFGYRILADTAYLLRQVHLVSMHMFPISDDLLEIQFRQAFLCQRSAQFTPALGVVEDFDRIKSREPRERDDKLATIVVYELERLGFQSKYCGYQYWKDAIIMLLTQGEQVKGIMQLYHQIAKRYGVTWNSVEKNMRMALSNAWSARKNRVWKTLYARKNVGAKAPSNSSFLYQLHHQIKRDYFW